MPIKLQNNGLVLFLVLSNCLDDKTEIALMSYALNKEGGIYYIYDKQLSVVPSCFETREADCTERVKKLLKDLLDE